MLSIFIANMNGLFLWNTKRVLYLQIAFPKVSHESKPKFGWIKVANLTIDQWNHGYKTMIYKCIQHIIKKNLLLLKDLLER